MSFPFVNRTVLSFRFWESSARTNTSACKGLSAILFNILAAIVLPCYVSTPVPVSLIFILWLCHLLWLYRFSVQCAFFLTLSGALFQTCRYASHVVHVRWALICTATLRFQNIAVRMWRSRMTIPRSTPLCWRHSYDALFETWLQEIFVLCIGCIACDHDLDADFHLHITSDWINAHFCGDASIL